MLLGQLYYSFISCLFFFFFVFAFLVVVFFIFDRGEEGSRMLRMIADFEV